MTGRIVSIVLCALSVVCPSVVDSKTVTVRSEYLYQVPENVTPDRARETALMRARIKAIADEFGTNITQTNSTMVSNSGGESSVEMLSLGGSELKGEWIEDIDPPVYEMITDGTALAIRVRIHGRIRDVKNAKVPLSVKILRNDVADGAESERFVSGDDIYVSFSAPVAGYLAIYLLDADSNAFCLLPYEAMTEGNFEVKANKKYQLFHPDYAVGVAPSQVDRIIADTERESEHNRVMVIFSPNKFYKGADSKIASDCPRSLSLTDFQNWLTNLRKKDMDLTVSEHLITISSK